MKFLKMLLCNRRFSEKECIASEEGPQCELVIKEARSGVEIGRLFL